MNKAIVSGRLTGAPELRYTQRGTAVCSFRIAVDDGYGENKKTNFIPVIVWDKQGEACGNNLIKGQSVIVDGRIQVRQYEVNDQKRTATEVVAQHVEFGAKPRGAQGQQGCQQEEPKQQKERYEQQKWEFRGTPFPDEDIPF